MRKLKVTNALLGKTYDDIQIYLGSRINKLNLPMMRRNAYGSSIKMSI